MGIVKILNEVTSKKDDNKNKKTQQQNESKKDDDMKRKKNAKKDTSFEKKVEMIREKTAAELQTIIPKMYPELFNGLGKIGTPHKIEVKEDASPVIHPPRKIPASLRDKLKDELDKMERAGVIRKVEEPTEWVNLMVVVEKPNGQLRICLDPGNLNKVIKREHYQLLTFEDIASRLSGVKVFPKLDANKGYWQVPLDEESIKMTTYNTPYGRYQFLRLSYGIHSAQEVFHKKISQSFENESQVETDVDDILTWGKDNNDHDVCLIRCLE